MDYKFDKNISVDEFESFASTFSKAHFMQSKANMLLKQNQGYITHLLGVKENDELVGACLLLEKNLYGFIKYFYIPRGMIVDYNNKQLLSTFIKFIANYVREHNGVFLKIDPDIQLREIDDNGFEIVSDNNNYELFDYLVKLGFNHQGFNYDFESMQPRYTYRLDIDKNYDDIRKGMHQTTRNILNKDNVVKVYKSDIKDIDKFNDLMHQTSQRANFDCMGSDYYNKFYEYYCENNHCDLYFASVDMSTLKNKSKEKIENIKHDLNSNISDKKKKELVPVLAKLVKELNSYDNYEDKEYTLSCMMVVKYGDKVWTVHGGNSDLLRELNSNYYMYNEIIKDANKDGYKVVDFFGTTGRADKTNPIYGIHLFKKRMGGEYVEFVGEFDLVFNNIKYNIYKKYAPKLRKILRK